MHVEHTCDPSSGWTGGGHGSDAVAVIPQVSFVTANSGGYECTDESGVADDVHVLSRNGSSLLGLRGTSSNLGEERPNPVRQRLTRHLLIRERRLRNHVHPVAGAQAATRAITDSALLTIESISSTRWRTPSARMNDTSYIPMNISSMRKSGSWKSKAFMRKVGVVPATRFDHEHLLAEHQTPGLTRREDFERLADDRHVVEPRFQLAADREVDHRCADHDDVCCLQLLDEPIGDSHRSSHLGRVLIRRADERPQQVGAEVRQRIGDEIQHVDVDVLVARRPCLDELVREHPGQRRPDIRARLNVQQTCHVSPSASSPDGVTITIRGAATSHQSIFPNLYIEYADVWSTIISGGGQ